MLVVCLIEWLHPVVVVLSCAQQKIRLMVIDVVSDVVVMKLLWSIMILIILGLQYRLWVGSGSFSEVWSLQKKVAMQQEANDALRERNEQLNADVLDLKSGYDAIEERARFNLGMVARDETFYMVVTSKL